MIGKIKIIRGFFDNNKDVCIFEKECANEINKIKEISIAPLKIIWLSPERDVMICIIEWCE